MATTQPWRAGIFPDSEPDFPGSSLMRSLRTGSKTMGGTGQEDSMEEISTLSSL